MGFQNGFTVSGGGGERCKSCTKSWYTMQTGFLAFDRLFEK